MSKWLKMAILAIFLMGASYDLGTVCGKLEGAYPLLLSPSRELLNLLLRFLIVVGAVAVTGGLVAALLRPVWVGMIAFALSALTLLLGWRMSVYSSLLALIYLLAGCVYAVGVARELNGRIKFSVRPMAESHDVLLVAAALVACGSLCLGCARYIAQEGLSIPEPLVEMFALQAEKRIAAEVPAEKREEAVSEFRTEFRRATDEFLEQSVKPYERLVPIAIAAGVFVTLVSIVRLVGWVPVVVLSIIFPLFAALGVTKIVSERAEVQRMVLG